METETKDIDSKNNDNLVDLEKTSWEEKRVDEQLMDANSTTEDEIENITLAERSNFRDAQIKKRERDEIEELHRMQKEKSNEVKSSQKKSSKKRKKKKKSSSDENNKDVLLNNLQNVPDNVETFTNDDDLVPRIDPDGACEPNAGAAHILEDQSQGVRFHQVINTHITDWWSYYRNKMASLTKDRLA